MVFYIPLHTHPILYTVQKDFNVIFSAERLWEFHWYGEPEKAAIFGRRSKEFYDCNPVMSVTWSDFVGPPPFLWVFQSLLVKFCYLGDAYHR